VQIDVCDKNAVNALFKKNKFFAVLHLAALKAVGESISIPLDYYKVNVYGTLNVLEVCIFLSLKYNSYYLKLFNLSIKVYERKQC
jgi:UDP-glucose 4-epimerase